MSNYELYHGDCLDIMPGLDGHFDGMFTDLPYGTTRCKWDEVIPLEPMWKQVKRPLKDNGVFATTSAQPFTSAFVMSNLEWYRYSLVWDKALPTGHLDANRRPMRRHEDILLFSLIGTTTYNPIMTKGKPYKKTLNKQASVYGKFKRRAAVSKDGARYPTSIIKISNAARNGNHPTEKPVALYEYLIRTYTNAGETVLDFAMGSGTTGVACIRTGRKFIGIEKNKKYFDIAKERIEQASLQPLLFADENKNVQDIEQSEMF